MKIVQMILLAIYSFLGLVYLFGNNSSEINFFLISTIGLFTAIGLYVLLIKTFPGQIGLRGIFIGHTILLAVMVTASLIQPDIGTLSHNYLLKDHAEKIVKAILVVLSPILPFSLISSLIGRKPKPSQSILETLRKANLKTQLYIIVFIVIMAVNSLGKVLNLGPVTYFGHIFFNGFLLNGFLVGYWFRKHPILASIWILVTIPNSILLLLAGGRFQAFFPFIVLGIGYLYYEYYNRKKLLPILLSIAIVFPLSFLVKFLGDFRKQEGRTSISEVGVQRIQKITEAFIENTAGVSYYKDRYSNLIEKENTLARLFPWPTATTIIYSPEKVPFFQNTYLNEELTYLFQLGISREEVIKRNIGIAMAKEYGYRVDNATSVEYGLIPGAYSMYGYPGIFGFSCLLFLSIIGLQSIYNYFLRGMPIERIVLSIYLLNLTYKSINITFFMIIRSIIFYLPVITFIFVLLTIGHKLYSQWVKQPALKSAPIAIKSNATSKDDLPVPPNM